MRHLEREGKEEMMFKVVVSYEAEVEAKDILEAVNMVNNEEIVFNDEYKNIHVEEIKNFK